MKKTNKKKKPAEYRQVSKDYAPAPGEVKTYSTTYGWVVSGKPLPDMSNTVAVVEEVKHG
jgi:hypothetical protein